MLKVTPTLFLKKTPNVLDTLSKIPKNPFTNKKTPSIIKSKGGEIK